MSKSLRTYPLHRRRHRQNLAWLHDRSKDLPFAVTIPMWWRYEDLEEAGHNICGGPINVGDVRLKVLLFKTEAERDALLDDYQEAKPVALGDLS